MREIRLSGSEGGGFEFNRFSLPLLLDRPFGAQGRLPKSEIWSCPGFPVFCWRAVEFALRMI